MSKTSTREDIVAAADRLFYHRGFEHTSFADIAAAVRISRGNFYYHFKTKDEILEAVIARRLASTQSMLVQWQAQGGTPAERIRCFINILVRNGDKIRQFGCPVGTLCSEMARLRHSAQQRANRLFTLFRHWLGNQFAELGHGKNADALAMHVLARSQGVATLANTFDDEAFIRQEVQALNQWLDQLATSRCK